MIRIAAEFGIELAQVSARSYISRRILPGLTKALRIIELEARICMLERQIDSVLEQARRKVEAESPAAELAREMRNGTAVFVSHKHEWVQGNDPRFEVCNRCPGERVKPGGGR